MGAGGNIVAAFDDVGDRSISIGEFNQHVGMAALAQLAVTTQVFAAQRMKLRHQFRNVELV